MKKILLSKKSIIPRKKCFAINYLVFPLDYSMKKPPRKTLLIFSRDLMFCNSCFKATISAT